MSAKATEGGLTDDVVQSLNVPTGSAGAEDQAGILRRAVEVIGDEAEAMRWMGTPIRALDYATPISLLHTSQGYEAVLTVLGRLEHGVL